MYQHLHTRRARHCVAAFAAAIVGGLLALAAPSPTAGARASFQLDRLAGAGRVQTAAAIALDSFSTANTALIVFKDDFPDGLSANYKAGLEKAPILMSGSDVVPQPTLDALEQLNTNDVLLVGGTSVLRPTVRAQLEAEGYNVDQIGGGNRYETAKLVALEDGPTAVGTDPGGKKTAFLTTGLKPWDAIAASPLSFAEGFPTLLTKPDALHPDAEAAIDELGIELVIILGGENAIKPEVETALTDKSIETARLEGDTRFDTAVDVASYAIDGLDYSTDHIDIATGRKFADALTGGPSGGNRSTPAALLLVGSVPEAVCTFLTDLAPTLASGHIFGGEAAVSEADRLELQTCGGASVPIEGVITAVDTDNDNYTLTDEAKDESVTIGFDDNNDVFTVDGDGASKAAFESRLSVGDRMRFFNDPTVPSEADTSDADEHQLIEKSPSDYTSGVVGDVDTIANTLHIIDPVSGVVLSDTKAYGGNSYKVDSLTRSLAFFENDLNEGDEIDIVTSGSTTTYQLSNKVVSGAVGSIDKDADEVTINGLGDDPKGPQQDRFDYVSGGSTNAYSIGSTTVNLAQFETALSLGDSIAYSREGDKQTFVLTDQPPQGLLAAGTGQEPDLDGDDDEGTTLDGGTITLVNGGVDVVVTYSANADFRRGTTLLTEPELEAELSAGDFLEYTPDNPGTPANEERLKLTNQNLQGFLTDVNTGVPGNDDGTERYDVVNASGNVIYNDLDYTDSVFGGGDSYFVDGGSQLLVQWENALSANGDGTKTITVSGFPANTRHDLSTA